MTQWHAFKWLPLNATMACYHVTQSQTPSAQSIIHNIECETVTREYDGIG